MNDSPVRFVPLSHDRKLSPVELVGNSTARLRPRALAPYCSSTYVSIDATCPDLCLFKACGCYVREGFTGRMSAELDRAAAPSTPDVVTFLEAEAINNAFGGRRGLIPQDGARGGRDLRLHVGGDVSSERGARWLAKAAAGWMARRGGSVWSYTHRWREVPRLAWGPSISVLASVESARDAHAAQRLGYAPALTTASFRSDRAHEVGGLKVIPCPAETRGVTCVSCRLCIDRDLVGMGVAIGFALHGRGAMRARGRLPVLESTPAPRNAMAKPAVAAEVSAGAA